MSSVTELCQRFLIEVGKTPFGDLAQHSYVYIHNKLAALRNSACV